MLSPRRLALALVVLLCTGNLWTSFVRSGIPLALDGVVESLEVRTEKHPGVDDVHLVEVGNRILHLDRSLAQHLSPGDVIRKRPWSTRLVVDGDLVDLRPSRDFFGMVPAMLLLIAAAWLVAPRRSNEPRRTG